MSVEEGRFARCWSMVWGAYVHARARAGQAGTRCACMLEGVDGRYTTITRSAPPVAAAIIPDMGRPSESSAMVATVADDLRRRWASGARGARAAAAGSGSAR